MNNFDLRQLRYFIAVAEELHFGRAARRLHISQPPLSQQIAALEVELGVQLFVRDRRKVQITAAGLQLLEDARLILADAKKLALRAQAAATGQTGIIRVGLNYTAPLSPPLSSLLSAFHKAHPDIGIELLENISAKQLDGLYQHNLDVCFLWPIKDDLQAQDISILPLNQDPLQLVLHRNHPLARKKNITIYDLRDFPIYLSLRQTRMAFCDTLITACQQAGFHLDIHTHINQLPFILNTVALDDGIAFLPEFLKRICPRECVFRPINFIPVKSRIMPLSLAYRKNENLPAVQNFIAISRSFSADRS